MHLYNDFNFESLEDFDNHKLIIFVREAKINLKGFIAIHRGGSSRPAFGATRIWNYSNELAALKDALQLSKIMSYKSALANLNYGGAKAVLIHSDKISKTRKNLLLKEYVHRVNYLNGHFITGADVGVNEDDVKMMSSESPYIVGVKSDPVKYTALGVYYSIQSCLKEIFGSESLSARTFAIQGLGKTGMSLLKLIYADSKKIFVTDIDFIKIKRAKRHFPKIKVVNFSQIDKQAADVFMPCALSNVLNLENISNLRFKIIAGSANVQLQNTQIGELLYKKEILYAPDYVVNAGGLIAVVDEFEHHNFNEERVMRRVKNIKNTLEIIILKSKKKHKATNLVADEMAEKIFNKFI